MAKRQYRHEDVAAIPKGWRVRTRVAGGHMARIAFSPTGKEKLKLVEILHPKSERNPCPNRAKLNPLLDSLVSGAAAAAGAVLATKAIEARKKKKNKKRQAVGRRQKAVGSRQSGASAVGQDEYRKDAELLGRAARKSNPNGGAAKMYADFHGRSPREVIALQESHVKAGQYAALGEMGDLWLQPVSNDVPFGQWPKPEIVFEKKDKVKLATDAEGKQLFLIGGNQEMLEKELLEVEAGPGGNGDRRFVALGLAYGISYISEKVFDGFQPTEYVHVLGEETGEVPAAYYDRAKKKILLVGGAYRIEPANKKLGASPGIAN